MTEPLSLPSPLDIIVTKKEGGKTSIFLNVFLCFFVTSSLYCILTKVLCQNQKEVSFSTEYHYLKLSHTFMCLNTCYLALCSMKEWTLSYSLLQSWS